MLTSHSRGRLSGARAFRRAGAALCVGVVASLVLSAVAAVAQTNSRTDAPLPSVLVEAQRRAFEFFWNETDSNTGLVKDRAGNFRSDQYTVSSIAATGFGLAAVAVGVENRWISAEEGRRRAIRTLMFLRDKIEHKNGWFYHFVDMRTGQRAWNSEVSSIDTGFLLAGALLAGECLNDAEVKGLARSLYLRVDFKWMQTDGGKRPFEKLLSHGWLPERGFLPFRWDSYCEHMLLYLLAIGSPTHPISADSWDAWARPVAEYSGHRTFAAGPLFVHQFSHAFVDFRGRLDRQGHDYWESSVQATLANRQFCLDNAGKYRTYAGGMWGLSASDGPRGYRAYAAPPGRAVHDGTVNPWAAITSVVFTPELSMTAAQKTFDRHGSRVWGRYGFSGAFNVDEDYWDQDVVGIDLGCALLMLENYRSGMMWKTFMAIPYVQEGMRKAGLARALSTSTTLAGRSF